MMLYSGLWLREDIGNFDKLGKNERSRTLPPARFG